MDQKQSTENINNTKQSIVQKRIQDWIKQGDENKVLNLSGLGLTELPDNIPESVKYLNCRLNRLTELKDLPSTLKELMQNRILSL